MGFEGATVKRVAAWVSAAAMLGVSAAAGVALTLAMAVALPVLLTVGVAGSAAAEEVVLRAVSALPEGSRFSRNFEAFIEKVNAEGQGLVRLKYIGGGNKVMNPFEVGNAVRGGVIHIASLPGAYYTNLLPEADALKLTEFTASEMRGNGAWEFINRIHNEKVNAYYLARQGDGIPFHLYLTERIDTMDLSGLKLRVTPVYQAFFESMGATMLRTPAGELYTALERGVVQGYGWPLQGILDLGWHEVTRYRVDPGFYTVELGVIVNLDRWNSLNEEQRAFLERMGRWLESLSDENPAINRSELQRQADVGIETIAFPPEVERRYLELAKEAGWARVMEMSPEHGPRMKQLFTK